ncbi:MAG: hypothetical protein Q4C00_01555 [Bacillota bacterium]|nr:hypothetical protein [Bacillota bacterium]
MTFYADYPDLSGLSPSQQIEELYNKFISLSREVEYAVNHIDSKNMTSAFNKKIEDDRGNISELKQTAEDFSIALESKVNKTAAYYSFTSDNFNIYNGGIKIWAGTPDEPGSAVFYADNAGNLYLKNVHLLDGQGVTRAGLSAWGLDVKAITFYDDNFHYIYARAIAGGEGRFILGGGGYGLSFIGENVSRDNGLEFYSDYARNISSSDGIPTDSEKRGRSGISLTGDVVINSFGDGYYRYPVVGDANRKLRMYLNSSGQLIVSEINAKTNTVIRSCIYTAAGIQ